MVAPPTDSLYKFSAIAGLVMVLWGAAFPWNKAYEAKLEGAQLQAQISAVAQKAEHLQAQYDALVREQEALASSSNSELERQEIRAMKRDLYIVLIEAQHPVDSGIEKLRVVEEATITYRYLGWASALIGVTFMLFGFLAWYFRIQRYIDRDMKLGRDHD